MAFLPHRLGSKRIATRTINVLAALAITLWSVAAHATAKQASAFDALFQQVARDLRHRTRIPVLLPRRLPDVGQGRTPVYASLSNAAPDSYEITLGFTPGCGGGTACRLGSIGARRRDPGEKQPGGKLIVVRTGIKGWFTPSRCGANCSDAIVMWRQRRIEYFVGLKAANKHDVIALANAVLSGVTLR
jgi:hypothetical protein